MKQARYTAFIAVCAVALLICGCGKGKDDSGNPGKQNSAAQSAPAPTAQQAAAQSQATAQALSATSASGGAATTDTLAAAAEQNRQALAQTNQGKQIAAVTVDTLKSQLPETLGGMTRIDASGERNQAMGFDISNAEAQYTGQNDASISLKVTDVGNLSGTMRLGMVGWTMAQYDRTTDTGYEKTATYSGYKGMEEYDNESKSGTIRVFVADRFVVELTGNNTSMDTIKQALGQVDLKKLASLASGS
ncbi:MAG: hypothetical protein ACM3VT_04975 [Solirubrobacterales bacterium]